jgi:hypothetical protein
VRKWERMGDELRNTVEEDWKSGCNNLCSGAHVKWWQHEIVEVDLPPIYTPQHVGCDVEVPLWRVKNVKGRRWEERR